MPYFRPRLLNPHAVLLHLLLAVLLCNHKLHSQPWVLATNQNGAQAQRNLVVHEIPVFSTTGATAISTAQAAQPAAVLPTASTASPATTAADSSTTSPNATTKLLPRIYIYTISEKFHNYTNHGDISDSFYGADQLLPEMIKASPYLTTNPDEADYFYVEAWLYWDRQGPGLEDLVAELRKFGPYYDRKHGKDHLFLSSGDDGRGWYGDPQHQNVTFIHHYGWLPGMSLQLLHECDLFKHYGSECDLLWQSAEAAISGATVWPCHLPRQDIIMPPPCFEPHPAKAFTNDYKTMYIDEELQGINRTDLLFYSGKIDIHDDQTYAKTQPWSDAYYSFGARQFLHHMFHDRPSFQLHSKHTPDSYYTRLSKSIFCVAAAGWGWGARMKLAITRGCIPVIVQDGIVVEWEEQLPLKDYAIRIPMWMAHKTEDILHAFIDTGRAARMQQVLKCAWRLHWWRRPHGRAFEMLMCELKRRVIGALKIEVDWEKCEISCGDGKPVRLLEGYHNV